MTRRLFGLELPFFVVAALCAVPIWRVAHPPIQDLPQHLATVRALIDFHDPALHFDDYYEIALGRTQYLGYYLVTALLAKLVGVALANRFVISAAIVGTPYAMRFLLRALGRDERAALLVLPLTWNAHLILGFVNFVGAIPLALTALALAIRARESLTPKRGAALALVLVAAFYTHVVPFGFAALGAVAILVGRDVRATAERLLALVPAGLAALVWLLTSPAGKATLVAARGHADAAGPQPIYVSAIESIQQIPMWLTDVLTNDHDDRLLAAFGVLLLLALTLPSGDRPASPEVARARWVVALLPAIAAIAYFVSPDSYDWIWPIHARFPLLALIFAIACVSLRPKVAGVAIPAIAAVLAIASVREVDRAFVAFDTTEVGPLDEAIALIPRGERVVGLIWDRGSREVKFSPFLHAVAYYQVARGGAVMFSFADFPASPLPFREDARPPRVWPRWEWTPERVDVRAQLGWYRYALVRGGPGAIGAAPDVWRHLGDRGPWHVYRRIGP